MDSIAVIAIVAAVLALAVGYIIKAKKRGAKCVGCPEGGSCGSCNCGCNGK